MPASAGICKGNDMLMQWVGICALLAIILAFEQHFSPESGSSNVTDGHRLVMYIMLGGGISAQTETFNGFFIVWFCSIGAYRVVKMALLWSLDLIGFKYLWRKLRGTAEAR